MDRVLRKGRKEKGWEILYSNNNITIDINIQSPPLNYFKWYIDDVEVLICAWYVHLVEHSVVTIFIRLQLL